MVAEAQLSVPGGRSTDARRLRRVDACRIAAAVTGSAMAVLGIVVLAAWALDSEAIKTLRPGWVAMFGAALLVVASILGFLSIILWNAREQNVETVEQGINRRLFQTSLDLILVVDRYGTFIRVSPSVTAILGFNPEEMIGRSAADFIFPADLDNTRQETRSTRRGGSMRNFECRYVQKDGHPVSLTWTGVWAEPERQYFFIGRDMTERRRAEENIRRLNDELEIRVRQRTAELEQQAAFARAVVDTASDAFVAIDTQGRVSAWNPSAERMFGWSAAEMLGHVLAERIIPPAQREGHRRGLERFLATGEAAIFNRMLELSALHRDGHELMVELSVWPQRFGDDWTFNAFLRDVTERKQAEEALKVSKATAARVHARLIDAIESLSDGFLLWDANDRLVLYNEAARRNDVAEGRYLQPGVTFAEVLEKRARSGIILEAQGREDEYIRQRLARHRNPTGEAAEQIFADGRWIAVRERRTSEGGVVSIRSDVTVRKRAEDALVRAKEATEVANRELEAFSYSVSHDLRAPLRAIDGFSRILLEEYAAQLPEQGRHFLGLVRKNSQKMGQLIDDLLAFSRLGRQPVKRERVDLTQLARDILDELRGDYEGREIRLTVDDLGFARVDPALLKQVLMNLLSNAIKFTGRKTLAEIRVGRDAATETPVYYVADNGAGFDKRYADKLFGVFQRLHRAEEYDGTGVGLAIVQRVIHRHGGRVWAEGEVEQGATFYFTLGDERDDATVSGNPAG